MYLSELDLQHLINHYHPICDKPLFIISPTFKILAATNPDLTSYASELLQLCTAQEDPKLLAERFGISIESCFIDQTLICYFMILDRKSDFLFPYLKTLVHILLHPRMNNLHNQTANSRSILVNQLSTSDKSNSEIDNFMKEFDYSYTCPRCAILLEISQDAGSTSNFKFDFSETYPESLITHHSAFSKEDIFGFVSSERYLIFKDTSVFSPENAKAELGAYMDSICTSMQETHDVLLHVGIGSDYSDLYHLQKSYLEALFLVTNYSFLNAEQNSVLHIQDYIFEYMTSLIPRNYWDNLFRPLSQSLENSPALLETVIQISRNSQNLTRTAEALGLHRNTILQRFQKFKSLSKLNPLQSDYDRMLLRTFSLHANQPITLQVGFVIQPDSVLHQGMKKMANLVKLKSNGAININIHTLSLSGDNNHLFETLTSGSIDITVAATEIMNRFTNNRTQVMDLPFLFHSIEEANHILNTVIIDDIKEPLESVGVKCLNIWSMGWRYLTSNHPIRVPQDMVGQKIRIMFIESLDEYYKSMGALPIKLNYGEVKNALRSGIIDCQENPYSNILGMKFYEEQAYITHLKYYLSTEALYFSKATWDKLKPAHQKIIIHATKEATDWIFTEQHHVINQQCKNTLIQEKGMQLIEVSDDEEAQWRSFSHHLYTSFPHQDLLKKIEQARKDFYARARNESTFPGI